MNLWLSLGLIFTFTSIVFVLLRWGNVTCIGVTPVKTFTFITILFTSGLDVGLIMFPLTEFGGYANLVAHPEYSFTNPLALEFGFWGFLIWGFYFLTCFYFCIIEPKVKFFEIPLIKLVNNVVIIGTCAFTAYLLLSNLPWYMPEIGDGKTIIPTFYLIVFIAIAVSVYSSTSLRYVKYLSLGSTWLFVALIAFMWISAFGHQGGTGEFFSTLSLIGGYFAHINHFILPMNDNHAFYLFWWFSWSLMIGQFTSRFVSGLKTWQLFGSMLVFPSIPIAIWFSILYYYHLHNLNASGIYNIAMITVGILFVVNSLDSLVRLYTDNLNITIARFGKVKYVVFNIAALSVLTLLFKLNFLEIQWVGALVIGLFFACFVYILRYKGSEVMQIQSSPKENTLDYTKVERA